MKKMASTRLYSLYRHHHLRICTLEEYRFTMPDDDTKIIHAVLRIGNNSRIMLADEFPGMCDSNHSDWKIGSPKTVGGNSVFLSMYFENVDEIFNKAQSEGATVVMPKWMQFGETGMVS